METPPFTKFKYSANGVVFYLRKIGAITLDYIRACIGTVLTSNEVEEMAYDVAT
jgi:hypothetical protein